MTDDPDPLALGQRVVAVLESGLRTATYKLATLQALVDFCVEHLPEDANAAVAVPLEDLAARVIEAYWPQLRPFEGVQLRQSSQSVSRILRVVAELRSLGTSRGLTAGPAQVEAEFPEAYEAAVNQVVVTLVQQPLNRLQRLPGDETGAQRFLYDDSWMTDSTTWRQISAHGVQVELLPGVGAGLARLSGLLRPVIQMLWTDDVRRLNQAVLAEDVPDIGGHLFGRSRISLDPARTVLVEAFGPRCFYCAREVRGANHVDHVLPWSRVGIDGLANLVIACARCNGDKKHALPAIRLLDRAVGRSAELLGELSAAINWPVQMQRTRGAARGLYRAEPAGSATWRGYRISEPLALPDPLPSWLA